MKSCCVKWNLLIAIAFLMLHLTKSRKSPLQVHGVQSGGLGEFLVLIGDLPDLFSVWIGKVFNRAWVFAYFIVRRIKWGNDMTFAVVYPKDIERLRIEKRAILIDIRPRNDYRDGHWEGAINYPEEDIEDYTKVLLRKRPVILYCQHGGSSMQLARLLGRNGYDVGSVVGGYEAMRKYKEGKK